MQRSIVLSFLVLSSCTAPTGAIQAPLLGDGGDAADRECNVVLRSFERARTSDGRPDTRCVNGLCWLRFEARVDVSAQAITEGATPAVLYRNQDASEWSEASAELVDGEFVASIVENGVRDGMSATALTRAALELVPFLRTQSGARLFDHNVLPGDFENYRVLATERFETPAGVCAGSTATLRFGADFGTTVEGSLRDASPFTVAYDLSRLPQCAGDTYMARRTWDTLANVRFLPSGATNTASVVRCDDERCLAPTAQSAEFRMPEGTTAIELWFQTSGRSCGVHWDSDFGANYRFDVLRAPGWVGAFTAKISRAGGAPCDGAESGGFGDAISFGTWARQRSITSHACFRVWSEGVTDRENPGGAVNAVVRCRWDGETIDRTYGVAFDGRVGNDARYRLDLRGIDPFRSYQCPGMPTRVEDQYETASATCVAEVNGEAWGPAGQGSSFRAIFSDYPNDPWRAGNCSN